MIGARHRQDKNNSSFSSTCTSVSSNPPWSDGSSPSPINHTVLSPQRSTSRSSRHLIFPIVPAARLPISPISYRGTLRDLCSPRQEPRPPADVLNRSYLSSCSPSLARFSRTTNNQYASASTSTTTLPSSTRNTGNFLHPTMAYLTISARRMHNHHHTSQCRSTR